MNEAGENGRMRKGEAEAEEVAVGSVFSRGSSGGSRQFGLRKLALSKWKSAGDRRRDNAAGSERSREREGRLG